jgi:hypothetical protein
MLVSKRLFTKLTGAERKLKSHSEEEMLSQHNGLFTWLD